MSRVGSALVAGALALLAIDVRAQAVFRTAYSVQVSSSYSVLEVRETPDGGLAVAGGRPMFLLKTLPSGPTDFFVRYDGDAAASLDLTSDGGFVLAGEQRNYDEYLVTKTDALGAPQWSVTYSQNTFDQGLYSIRQASDGGYVASGIFTMKLDSVGAMVWNTIHIGGGGNVNCVRLTADGGIVATGEGSYGSPANDYNLVVTRMTAGGAVTWNRAYGGDMYDWSASAQELPDGTFVVAGWTSSFGAGGRDGFVMSLDASGTIAWAVTVGTPGDDALQAVTPTSDGGFIASGAMDSQAALVKLTRAGALDWAKAYPTSATSRGSLFYSVLESPLGGFAAAGKDESSNLLLLRTDASGDTGACSIVTPPVVVANAPFLQTTNSTNGPGNWTQAAPTITGTPATPPVVPCVPFPNTPPTCDAGPDATIGCGSVTMSAAIAADADFDPLTFAWTSNCGAVFAPSASVLNPAVDLPPACDAACVLTLAVDDGQGGTCNSQVVITTRDDAAPSMTCPASLVLHCGDVAPPADVAQVAATDTCNGPAIVVHVGDLVSGTCPGDVSIVRTYRATDACGNSATCTQDIFVYGPEVDCADGRDNDQDNAIDCADSDCANDPLVDCDGDGTANGADCAPTDAAAWIVPPEIPSLVARKVTGAAALTWTDTSAQSGPLVTQDVVSGAISALWLDRGFASASCLARDVATHDDARAIPAHAPGFHGDGFWYLVRARNACGPGTYGAGTTGTSDIDPTLCN